VIAALAFTATDLQLGGSDADTVARSGDAKTALVALERAGIGEGALVPHEILVEGGADPERVAAALNTVEGVHGAVAPAAPDWRRGRSALVEAIPIADSGEHAARRRSTRSAARPTRPARVCASAASPPPTPTSSTPSTAAFR
jgi:hypothetical protein